MGDLIADDKARIASGAQVTLHFSLLLPSGQEIDTTRNGKPASFVVGDGSLLPGFEAVLLGQTEGFHEQVVLPANDAFGEHNPDNVRLMARDRFAGVEEPLEPGLVVSFAAADGELPGVVLEVYDKTVKVDFNHPLAGQDITFDVSVIKVATKA